MRPITLFGLECTGLVQPVHALVFDAVLKDQCTAIRLHLGQTICARHAARVIFLIPSQSKGPISPVKSVL